MGWHVTDVAVQVFWSELYGVDGNAKFYLPAALIFSLYCVQLFCSMYHSAAKTIYIEKLIPVLAQCTIIKHNANWAQCSFDAWKRFIPVETPNWVCIFLCCSESNVDRMLPVENMAACKSGILWNLRCCTHIESSELLPATKFFQ